MNNKILEICNALGIARDGALLPAGPGVCQSCAFAHDPVLPHNQQSIYWQHWFYNRNGRWPTWHDAMEHCSDEMKEAWLAQLRDLGVDIAQPEKPARQS